MPRGKLCQGLLGGPWALRKAADSTLPGRRRLQQRTGSYGQRAGQGDHEGVGRIVDKVKTLNVGPGARTLNNATEAAQNAAALRSVKGVVKLVDGSEIWVSLGANSGFAKGDKVKIYQPVGRRTRKAR